MATKAPRRTKVTALTPRRQVMICLWKSRAPLSAADLSGAQVSSVLRPLIAAGVVFVCDTRRKTDGNSVQTYIAAESTTSRDAA